MTEQEQIPDLFSLRKAISHKNQNYWIERLIGDLPALIEKAASSVNPRERHFNLDNLFLPSVSRHQGRSEAEWESLCLSRWTIRHGVKYPRPIRNAWHRLIGRQVPLEPPIYGRQLLTADLVGISEDGFPVVVELKGQTKQAAILTLILQALDYGIRLKESWLYFFNEWQEIAAKYGWPMVQSHPHCIYLVCAAPSDYWRHERSPRFAPDFAHFEGLKSALATCGFPLSLVSLITRRVGKTGFRVTARPIDLK